MTDNKDVLNAVGSEAIHALMEAGIVATEPTLVLGDDTSPIAAVYTVPDGYTTFTVDLEALRAPYRSGPDRPRGSYTVRDVRSFLSYYAKHAENEAEIWVSPTQITAVLDATPAVGEDGDTGTRWEGHRLTLELQPSTEWTRWSRVSGKLFGQEEFAEFLEDAAADVVAPDMATILETVQSLVATTKVEFESAYRTSDGQRAFKYKETMAAKAGQKGELEIPERIMLALRVYEGQERTDIPARFRFRLNGDQLRLGVIIDRMPEVLEAALYDVTGVIIGEIDRGSVFTGPAPHLRAQ